MANRNLNRPFCYQKMLTLLTGVIPIASGGAVGTALGIGYSVVKTSPGLYTVTVEDQFPGVQGILTTLFETTLSALDVKGILPYSSITTGKLGTFQLQIFNAAGSAADVGSASEIHFQLNGKNTSVPR